MTPELVVMMSSTLLEKNSTVEETEDKLQGTGERVVSDCGSLFHKAWSLLLFLFVWGFCLLAFSSLLYS